MVVLEYLVRCPFCSTESKIVSEEVNPIIYGCPGCEWSVVLHNNNVYTVKKGYFSNLLRKHKTKACGQVVSSRLSAEARGVLTKSKLGKLTALLKEPMDVSEFIKRLDSEES